MYAYSCPDDFLFYLITTSPTEAKKKFKQSIKDEWGNACCYCGSTDKLSLDHVVPKIRGGKDLKNNLVCSCVSCNRDKGHSVMEEWYQNQPFFSEVKLNRINKWLNNEIK